MRAVANIHRAFSKRLPEIHAKRINAVFAAVEAVLACGCAVAVRLGRAVAVGTSHKHGIKRIDRLLGNAKLQRELEQFYGELAAHVLRGQRRPVLLVDWTEFGADKCAITAAVAVHGRALAVYSQAYPIRRVNSALAHRRFIAGLRALLGPDVRPIIVADAGFHSPFMKLVCEQGWDYVCRVRGRKYVGDGSGWCVLLQRAYGLATDTPLDMPSGVLGQDSRAFATRLVLVDRRSRRARKRSSLAGRRIRAVRAAKGAREPWLLATSLDDCHAERIIALYALRMQIEETFRDTKSPRFGWGLSHARTRTVPRLATQLLLVALASAVAFVVGLAAESAGLERRYQANTVRERRVLSLTTLGALVLRDVLFAPRLDDALRDTAEIIGLHAAAE